MKKHKYKKKYFGGFGLIEIIVIAAIIAAAGIGGGLYFKESKNQQNLIELGRQKEKEAEALKEKILRQQRQQLEAAGENPATSQPSPIDTSTWKTYRNEKYGFEVEYSSSWKVEFSDPYFTFTPLENKKPERIFIEIKASDARFRQSELKTLGEWLWQRPNASCGEKVIGQLTWCTAGEKFEGVRSDNYGVTQGGKDYIIQFNVGYGRQRTDYYLLDEELEEINVLNHILSTFKFIK